MSNILQVKYKKNPTTPLLKQIPKTSTPPPSPASLHPMPLLKKHNQNKSLLGQLQQ
jgi:hypothetical protein